MKLQILFMLIMLGGAVLLAKLLGIETVHSDKRGLWLVQFVPPWSKANYWKKKHFSAGITVPQPIFWKWGGNIGQKCKRSLS